MEEDDFDLDLEVDLIEKEKADLYFRSAHSSQELDDEDTIYDYAWD